MTAPSGRGHPGGVTALLLRLGIGLALALLGAIIVLPLLALLLRVPLGTMLVQLSSPVVGQALWLSLETTLIATVVVGLLGLPAAYLLATRDFPGKRLVEGLLDVPMVLPPTVGGLGLLLAFGRTGLAGSWLRVFGLSIPFTIIAVILAQVFMALPLFIGAARAGFQSVDPRLREVAATLRAGEAQAFWRVMLPLSFPSVLAGMAMAGARALGEFGATITFAGNLPGVTQTMPLAVYVEMQRDLDTAITLSVVLLVFSLALLLALRTARPVRF